jgi:hypothetical protein
MYTVQYNIHTMNQPVSQVSRELLITLAFVAPHSVNDDTVIFWLNVLINRIKWQNFLPVLVIKSSCSQSNPHPLNLFT